MRPLHQLHSITNEFLQLGEYDYSPLRRVANELFRFLATISEINPDESGYNPHTILPTGKALNTEEAAFCIRDIQRTKRFIDGIAAAVKDQRQKFPDRPIHILYAGTGPFATLLLPLTGLYSSHEMKWTLLEAHTPTFDHLQRNIEILELEDYIDSIHHVDASTWQIPTGSSFDILISETMQKALIREPQVAIWKNLLPQVNDQCIIIPQQVVLELAWVDFKKRMQQKTGNAADLSSPIYPIATIFDLNREMILSSKDEFTPVHIQVTPSPTEASLFITTRITVYNQFILKMDECGLTLPLEVRDLPAITAPVEVECFYEVGTEPGIKFHVR